MIDHGKQLRSRSEIGKCTVYRLTEAAVTIDTPVKIRVVFACVVVEKPVIVRNGPMHHEIEIASHQYPHSRRHGPGIHVNISDQSAAREGNDSGAG